VLFTRAQLEALEKQTLAPYATFAAAAKREFPEIKDDYRTAFQRDRARIIHSKSFRRLKGKTQVFVAHYGDHYRNRLTHTLEVAQLSRDLARSLGLNEDLAESIALAHDLGHTPFGHVGERKLDELLQPFGRSFEHNQQSRRILTVLEKKYPDSDGLNLTHDLLDGLAKHQSEYDRAGEAFAHQPSLEAQIVNLADEIAYTNHDLDDGLRSGIFHRADLADLRLWQIAIADVDPSLPEESFIHRAVSALIHAMATDLLAQTEKNLQAVQADSLAAIQNHAQPLAAFSADFAVEHGQLKSFLYKNFYLSPSVKAKSEEGADMIEQIFAKLLAQPELISPEFATRLQIDPAPVVVADFVAGMTDSYAKEFLVKLT
jgi:dGTPase